MRGLFTSAALAGALTLAAPATAQQAEGDAGGFADTLERARGQTVDFFAWGGSEPVNDHIAWAAEEVEERYGVELRHVKLTDTGEAVAQVLAEKSAGRDEGGNVDLIWINGENFRSMRANGLLHGPFAFDLPNFGLVDTEGKPTTLVDFTVPTDGYESPWGMAQFVLIHDEAATPEPPRSLDTLGAWVEANPGRFTHPAPPDFIGTTFLKHLLVGLAPEDFDLSQSPGEDAEEALAPVRGWLERHRQYFWRAGTSYPRTGPEQHQLFEDGSLDLTFAFNPAEAATYVLDGRFPETTRSYAFEEGTIANTHFVAIPFNAGDKAGAEVVANFLLSPEAQARKQDPEGWGDFTVLNLEALNPDDRALFEALDYHPATPTPEELLPALPEPHPEWVPVLENLWLQLNAG